MRCLKPSPSSQAFEETPWSQTAALRRSCSACLACQHGLGGAFGTDRPRTSADLSDRSFRVEHAEVSVSPVSGRQVGIEWVTGRDRKHLQIPNEENLKQQPKIASTIAVSGCGKSPNAITRIGLKARVLSRPRTAGGTFGAVDVP